MKKLLNNSYINLIFRIILGAIFLIAATSKIADPSGFAGEIANYKIVPQFMNNILAITLPWIELVCALFIITGIRLKSTTAILGVLLIVFNIAIFIALAKGLNINCGCHTKIMAEQVGWQKLLENAGLFLCAVYIFYSRGAKLTLENYIFKKTAIAKMSVFRNLN
ncbi:MauE/DoxX family redox-associated membrane protein [Bacteroidota bacterium]